MLVVATYVDKSPIHGRGVFTRVPIRRGETVWRFDECFDFLAPVENFGALDEMTRALVRAYTCRPWTEPRFRLVETDNGRFMNHGDVPNLSFLNLRMGMARRDIAAHEELTCDYDEVCMDGKAWLPSVASHAAWPPLMGPASPLALR
jgi:SET domain-containing protein